MEMNILSSAYFQFRYLEHNDGNFTAVHAVGSRASRAGHGVVHDGRRGWTVSVHSLQDPAGL